MPAILRLIFWRVVSVLLLLFLYRRVLYIWVGNYYLHQYPYRPFQGHEYGHSSFSPRNLSRGSFLWFLPLPVTQRSINFFPYSHSNPPLTELFIEFFQCPVP